MERFYEKCVTTPFSTAHNTENTHRAIKKLRDTQGYAVRPHLILGFTPAAKMSAKLRFRTS